MLKRIVIAGALWGLLSRRNKLNLRKGTLAHESFFECVDKYMKEHNIEWSDLNIDGSDLIELYENYEDDKINEIFKSVKPDLPNLELQ